LFSFDSAFAECDGLSHFASAVIMVFILGVYIDIPSLPGRVHQNRLDFIRCCYTHHTLVTDSFLSLFSGFRYSSPLFRRCIDTCPNFRELRSVATSEGLRSGGSWLAECISVLIAHRLTFGLAFIGIQLWLRGALSSRAFIRFMESSPFIGLLASTFNYFGRFTNFIMRPF
jgi:hypothetical protein